MSYNKVEFSGNINSVIQSNSLFRIGTDLSGPYISRAFSTQAHTALLVNEIVVLSFQTYRQK